MSDDTPTPNELSERGFVIERVLGQNVHGGRVTYLARGSGGERVVLKRFSFAHHDASWSGYKAHERELAALRELDHPSIPRFLDAIESRDGFFLAQEYKEAAPVDTSRQWGEGELVGVARSLLSVLAYVQSRPLPLIHRDIKPDNILLNAAGELFLIDFGLAKGAESSGASTVAAGTPGFMAPEQFFSDPLTPSTDLYGAGATLIAMATGTPAERIRELVDRAFRFDTDRLAGSVSPELARWMTRMVDPEPAGRPASASRALEELERAIAAQAQQAMVPTSLSLMPIAAIALGLVVLSLIFVSMPLVLTPPEPPEPPAVPQPLEHEREEPPFAIEGSTLTCTGAVGEVLRAGEGGIPRSLELVEATQGSCLIELRGFERIEDVQVLDGARVTIQETGSIGRAVSVRSYARPGERDSTLELEGVRRVEKLEVRAGGRATARDVGAIGRIAFDRHNRGSLTIDGETTVEGDVHVVPGGFFEVKRAIFSGTLFAHSGALVSLEGVEAKTLDIKLGKHTPRGEDVMVPAPITLVDIAADTLRISSYSDHPEPLVVDEATIRERFVVTEDADVIATGVAAKGELFVTRRGSLRTAGLELDGVVNVDGGALFLEGGSHSGGHKLDETDVVVAQGVTMERKPKGRYVRRVARDDDALPLFWALKHRRDYEVQSEWILERFEARVCSNLYSCVRSNSGVRGKVWFNADIRARDGELFATLSGRSKNLDAQEQCLVDELAKEDLDIAGGFEGVVMCSASARTTRGVTELSQPRVRFELGEGRVR